MQNEHETPDVSNQIVEPKIKQHTFVTEPGFQPTQAEADAVAKGERERAEAAVASEVSVDTLLARIEPEGRDLYAVAQNLEKSLLLSIAISLCTSVSVPVAANVEDGTSGYIVNHAAKRKANPTRKGKQPSRKVGRLPVRKAGKGRGDKGDDTGTAEWKRSLRETGHSANAPAGISHWKRKPARKGKRKAKAAI